MISGKLKHSLKEKCPECGKVLQLRVINTRAIEKGNEIEIPIEYICCSNRNCDYERDIEQKRVRRKEDFFDKPIRKDKKFKKRAF